MILKTTLGNEYSEPPKKRGPKPTEPQALKITKITKQLKNADRYSVYIDEKYSFSLSEYQLAGARLFIGKEFTPQELEDFVNESLFGKAYERALNYVMIRPRSRREITDYLNRTFLYPKPKSYKDKNGQIHIKRQEVDKPKVTQMIARVMARLEDKGYINDQSFAKAWINSRQLTKKTSKRKLGQELRAKGVDQEVIATELQNDNINETQNLRELIAKKRRLSKYKEDTKLTQYLLRQGYNYDDIRDELK